MLIAHILLVVILWTVGLWIAGVAVMDIVRSTRPTINGTPALGVVGGRRGRFAWVRTRIFLWWTR